MEKSNKKRKFSKDPTRTLYITISYLNSNVGKVKNRLSIMNEISMIENPRRIDKQVINEYLKLFAEIGFLELLVYKERPKPLKEKYKILRDIPENMNSMIMYDLLSEIRNESWKVWFMSLDDRINASFNKRYYKENPDE